MFIISILATLTRPNVLLRLNEFDSLSFNASSTGGNLNQLVLTSSYLSSIGPTQEDASWSLLL